MKQAADFLSALITLLSLTIVAGASPRVAVVNDIPGHFEVLAGVLASLRRIKFNPDVYFVGNPAAPESLGLIQWLQDETGGREQWVALQPYKAGDTYPQADLLICISAELAPQVCQGMIALLHPRMLLAWVHRADIATAGSKVLSLHSQYALLALSPHVASLASLRFKQPVGWALPVLQFQPPGSPCANKACLRHFAIQGTIRKFRNKRQRGFTRNYAELWSRLTTLRTAAVQAGRPSVRVLVVGKGMREELMIPSDLGTDVKFMSKLPYPQFWGNISSAFALVPAFGMPVYTVSRISSTLLASLVCGVPMIADQELLNAYSFLKEEHVFLRQPGEDEAAAMYRIMFETPEDQLFARRRALLSLRQQMNERADGIFKELLAGLTRT